MGQRKVVIVEIKISDCELQYRDINLKKNEFIIR